MTLLIALARACAPLTLVVCGVAMAQQPPAPLAATDPARAATVLAEPADRTLASIILIGDSTVRNGRDDGQGKGADGQWGWGTPFASFFDRAKVNVVNRAVGGLSSRTYLTSGHWERTLSLVRRGDVVIMQFGHNDASPVNDNTRARGTLKGIGEQSTQIDNLLTGKPETVHTYGWYLRRFIADIRAAGATPVLASPVPRNAWSDSGPDQGKAVRSRDTYAGWAEQVARSEHVAFIDLNEMIARHYDGIGRDAVMRLFTQTTPEDKTHTNRAGAELNARIAFAALMAQDPRRFAPWRLAAPPSP